MAPINRLNAMSGIVAGVVVAAVAVRQQRLERRLLEERRRQEAADKERAAEEGRLREETDQQRMAEANRRREAAEPGVRTLQLLTQFHKWVYRRVEAVEFRDDTTVVRKVSVDFQLPQSAPRRTLADGSTVRLVPLTWVKKRPLRNFDIRDENAAAMPLLRTSDRNGLITKGLVASAETLIGRPQLDIEVENDIRRMVEGSRNEAEQILQQWKNGSGIKRELFNHPEFGMLLRRAAHNTVIIVPMREDSQPHRIIKYCSEERFHLDDGAMRSVARSELNVNERVASTLGTRSAGTRFSTPAVQDTQSYHFELASPPGVDIAGGVLVGGRPFEQSDSALDAEPGGDPRLHLYVSDVPLGSRGTALVWLRPSSHELRQVVLAASMIAVILLLGAVWVWTSFSRETAPPWESGLQPSDVVSLAASHDSRAAAAATLLILLPAVFATLLARPTEHAMASRLLHNLRLLVILSAGLAYIAAATLIAGFPPQILRVLWVLLTFMACLVAVVVAASYRYGPEKSVQSVSNITNVPD